MQDHQNHAGHEQMKRPSKLKQYRPLMVVLLIVLLLDFGTQALFLEGVTLMDSLRYFMAYFFLLFGSFKLLDIKGFVDMYAEYDVIAKQSRAYAYVYPFIELILGISFLLNLAPIPTNVATAVVMGIGSIGVIKAVTGKRKIRCACLGAVVKLPMSTVTIIEDIGMGGMAIVMLILLWP